MLLDDVAAGWDLATLAQIVAAVFAVLAAIAIPLTAYRRRPHVRLTEDGAKRHSHVEADGVGYLRLVVANKRRRRAARGTRVIVEGYRLQTDPETELVSLSHPSLRWPSAVEAAAEATLTVYSGSSRPIGLGQFVRAVRGANERLVRGSANNIAHFAADNSEGATWHLCLALHNLDILDDRDKLSAGAWVIQLLVGADDGDAHRYDVHIAWDGNSAQTAEQVLAAALGRLDVISR